MQVMTEKNLGQQTIDAQMVPVLRDLSPGPGAEPLFGADGIRDYLRIIDFSATDGATTLPNQNFPVEPPMVLVGVGDGTEPESIRRAIARGARLVPNAKNVSTTLHQLAGVRPVVEGFGLADYHPARPAIERTVSRTRNLILSDPVTTEDWAVITDAKVSVDATNWARDLVNTPAYDLGPDEFIREVQTSTKGLEMETEVWEERRLREEYMGGILAVGAGSDRPPRLLRVSYRPDEPNRRVFLVGKGIIFDSGGLSIKPAEYMEKMKTDMSGAAVVAAVVRAAALLELEIEVHGLLPLAENLVGGSAMRPGDVLRCRNGKTIEVLNTDAEGRLVMADCLALATENLPDEIIDVATLTGACRVALGDRIGGVFANRRSLAQNLLASGEQVGEKWWELPLADDYRPQLRTELADMKNIGSRYGGAITAALLLSEFVGDFPWAHLDIAGPARSDKTEHYLPEGATGFGVRTLLEYLNRTGSHHLLADPTDEATGEGQLGNATVPLSTPVAKSLN